MDKPSPRENPLPLSELINWLELNNIFDLSLIEIVKNQSSSTFQKENHKKSNSIRTKLPHLYLLDFKDKLDFLNKSEIKNYSGLYLLIDSQSNPNEIYVGESSNYYLRIKSHMQKPPSKNFNFDKIILIWDNKPTAISFFGEEGFRKSLEKKCINVFKSNYSKYKNRNRVKNPKATNYRTERLVHYYEEELYKILKKYELIHTIP